MINTPGAKEYLLSAERWLNLEKIFLSNQNITHKLNNKNFLEYV
jgi:hypothetical protein